ncbi:MAG: response regulator [Hyphomonadaceae bacterium]|nr:response regulator [Hyphomonadaceae bacterium]
MVSARHLVLVDDDPHVLNALRFSFETEGYEVRTFARGEDLLEDPPTDPGTCLVIDERLPGLSGLDTVARLRARGISMPAVLITTHPTESMVRRAATAGIGIVEKPLIGDALATTVRAMLGPSS